MMRHALLSLAVVIAAAGLLWNVKRAAPPATPIAKLTALPERMPAERAIAALNLPTYVAPSEIRDVGSELNYSAPGRNTTIRFNESIPAVSVGDVNLLPLFGAYGAPRAVDGRVIYDGFDSSIVYTPSPTGVKEDVILYAPPASSNFAWQLNLPTTMEARLLDDGSVGIFDASNDPYAGVQVCDHRSAELIERGRANLERDRLRYRMPRPYAYDSAGRGSAGRYSLASGLVGVSVSGLESMTYPVTVDPPITISSTAEFLDGGNNDGNVNYATAGEIRRSKLGGGNMGAWTVDAVNTFLNPRHGHASLAYGGKIYVLGGTDGTTFYNDIQYSTINTTTGTISTFTTNVTSFTTGRAYFGAAALNGFMYIFGGEVNNDPDQVQDVQMAPINSDGSLGAWSATTLLPSKRSRFATAYHAAAIYVIAGLDSGAFTSEVLAINTRPSGALGPSWFTTSPASFTKDARALVHNGYVYLVGGVGTGFFDQNSVGYSRINGDGTLAGWNFTSSMNVARSGFALGVCNGYLVASGGSFQHTEMAPLGSSGELGPWRSDQLSEPEGRSGCGSAWFNNRLYMTGGDFGGVPQKSVQYAAMQAAGWPSNPVGSGNSPVNRINHGAIAWNGYIYVVGGHTDTANTLYTANVSYTSINPTTGFVNTPWATGTALPSARAYVGVAVYNGRLYVCGGQTGPITADGATYYTTLSPTTGAPGGWISAVNLFTGRKAHGTFIHDDRLYVVGGQTGLGSEWTNTLWSQLDSGGNPGVWQNGGTFNGGTGQSHAGVEVYRNKIYVVGGQNGASTLSTVRIGTIDPVTFNVSYVTSPQSLPEARQDMFSFVCNDNLYVGTGRTTNVATVGVPNMFFSAINSDGTLVGWTQATYYYDGIGKRAVQRNGMYYITCGNEGGSPASYTDTFRVTPNGTIGVWTTDTSLPTGRFKAAAAGRGDFIYVSGGNYGIPDVIYQAVDSAGRLTGAWSTTSPMPFGNYYHRMVIFNQFVYVVGGANADTACYVNTINANGTIGDGLSTSWTAVTSLPEGLYSHGLVEWNGWLYAAGGYNTFIGDYNTKVFRAQINPSTGTLSAWTTDASLPVAQHGYSSAAVHNGFLYLAAGSDNSSSGLNSVVEFAAINGDGSLGAFNKTTSLPLEMQFAEMHAQDGFIYVATGYSNVTSNIGIVLRAPLAANGRLGDWNETTLLPASNYAGVVIGHRGHLYSLGGYNSGPVADVFQSPIYSPAQRSQWSRRIDLGSDKELLNISFTGSGASKGIGRAKIFGSTSAANAYGGTPLKIIDPIDMTGTSVSLSNVFVRYVAILIDLDDTRSGPINPDNTIERDLQSINLTYNSRPNTPTTLAQFENGGGTSIPTGGGANDGPNATTTVTFRAFVADAEGENCVLSIEAVQVLTGFSSYPPGTATVASAPATSGTTVTVAFGAFTPGAKYHWRAWATDSAGANSTSPVSYPSSIPLNTELATDFYIDQTPAVPNITPAANGQFEADGLTVVVEGNAASSNTISLKSPVSDPDGILNTITLEFEIRDLVTAFTDAPTHSLPGLASGTTGQIYIASLAVLTDYHWQARTKDSEGVVSAWVKFGAVPEAGSPFPKDFSTVNANPPVIATAVQQNPSSTVIVPGGETAGVGVEFVVNLTDPDLSMVKLQVEVRISAAPFTSPSPAAFAADGIFFFETAFAASGSNHTVTIANMLLQTIDGDGSFHWQVRAVDNTPSFNLATAWTTYTFISSNPNPHDFFIDEVNDAPVVSTKEQYRPDGTTVLASGASTPAVTIKGTITDPNNPATLHPTFADCRLQIEIQPGATPFVSDPSPAMVVDNITTFESTVAKGDGTTTFTVPQSLFSTSGSYRWQVRAVDYPGGVPTLASAWSGPGGSPDFVIVANGAATDPATLDQIETAIVTSIPEGFTILTQDVSVQAVLADALGQTCKMQLEFRPVSQPFTSPSSVTVDGVIFFETAFTTSGATHSIPFTALIDQGYKWQVRNLNFGTNGTDGIASNWIGFGANPPTAPDFRIDFANDPPALPTGLTQLTPPDNRPVNVGGTVVGRTVILKAEARDPENDVVALEFELQTDGVAFTGTPTHSTVLGPPGQPVSVTINDLAIGAYHWQVRARDRFGSFSLFVEFGGNSGADFVIDATAAINPNQPVSPSQWLANNSAIIPTGATIAVTALRLKATVTHPRGEAVKLQVEIQRVNTPFSNVPTGESAFVSTGTIAEALIIGRPNGYYHWQCRTVDTRGGVSNWISYGGNAEETPADDPLTGADESDPAVSTQANDVVIDTGVGANPDLPVIIGQYKDNGITPVGIGGSVTAGTLVFRAFLTDSNGDAVRLEIEVKPLGVAFDGRTSGISDFFPNGSSISMSISGLPDGPYKWRALAVDSTGASSAFVDFGANAETVPDFKVAPVTNAAPTDPTQLNQLKLDGVTSIEQGGIASILGLNFSGLQADTDNDQVRVEVEVRNVGTTFANAPTAVGEFSPAGFAGQVSMTGFRNDEQFHWQLRVTDSTGTPSGWVVFGNNTDPDGLDFMTTTNGVTSSSGKKRKCGSVGFDLLIPLALLWMVKRKRK